MSRHSTFKTKTSFIGLIAALLFSLNSCVAVDKKTATTVPNVQDLFKGTYTVDPAMKKHMPRTVAVLPFIDQSKSQKGQEEVRRGFYNHFSSLPFQDMELVRVDYLLKKAGLTDAAAINQMPAEKFKEILNVDAVVYGTISNFDKLFAGIYSQVSVGAEIKMVDTAGRFLWSGQHVSRIHEGGISASPVGLVAAVFSASMNLRDIQLLRACDDLFREMVQTIPAPSSAQAVQPPVITLLAQDTKGIVKKAGDEIRVVLKGDSNRQAWFDIGNFKRGIPMKEVEPGGYLGTYRPVPGDNADKAIVTGYLSDDAGNTSKWIDAVGTVSIDTAAPQPPLNLQTSGRDHIVLLRWKSVPDKDLAGYQVLRSQTPLSGYEPVGQTELAEFADQTAENLVPYYYKIVASDVAGNQSESSEFASGTAIAPGPTPVTGPINDNTKWYAGASPYLISEAVTITADAMLSIEPGTRVVFNGGGLIIQGALNASGESDRLISFESANKAQWQGILFDRPRGEESRMVFCRVQGANQGIECRSSSPFITRCELIENQTGVLVTGGFSQPKIEECMFRNNSLGAVITDGAAPEITGNKIRNSLTTGMMIQNAGAAKIHGNLVIDNQRGILVGNSPASILHNNIYDNLIFDIQGPDEGKPVAANDNWWGKTRFEEIMLAIRGRVTIDKILSSQFPGAESRSVPLSQKNLAGAIKDDVFLLMADSPYRVTGELSLENGATIYIQPGVRILFEKDAAICVKDGGIIARGRSDSPIVFTSSGSPPAPGDYLSAARFCGPCRVSSFFEFCRIEYAVIALDIGFCSPDITRCHIVDNAQSAVRCGNDSGPKILYNTFEKNLGTGAIECVGHSKPMIQHNNFKQNAIALQAFSTIFIDARYNFWGSVPPDTAMIWGANVNIEPWLQAPEPDAFTAP